MKSLDRELQRRRIAKALPFISPGSSVLDVGCHEGALFRAARDRIARGIGIDVAAPETWVGSPHELRVGEFPDVLDPDEMFDVIVMLAVVEHVSPEHLAAWAKVVPDLLVPGGRLIVTTPSPRVDEILHVLITLRVLDGIGAHEHHRFDPRTVPGIFGSESLILERRQRFQLGLNHLFVFRKA
jgi:2-polyprenyl-3-methyl-5-hydroxy-6-metoxy-1,4-benzoquinol methylase